jgi:hypothetical protein
MAHGKFLEFTMHVNFVDCFDNQTPENSPFTHPRIKDFLFEKKLLTPFKKSEVFSPNQEYDIKFFNMTKF